MERQMLSQQFFGDNSRYAVAPIHTQARSRLTLLLAALRGGRHEYQK
jgi:hypothetical protein